MLFAWPVGVLKGAQGEGDKQGKWVNRHQIWHMNEGDLFFLLYPFYSLAVLLFGDGFPFPRLPQERFGLLCPLLCHFFLKFCLFLNDRSILVVGKDGSGEVGESMCIVHKMESFHVMPQSRSLAPRWEKITQKAPSVQKGRAT